MKKDIKYTLNLVETDGAQARAELKAAELEADNQLTENAKIRLGDVKLEKWWSVAAGMALILAFILYTFYLTIPAVILFVLLGAFIIYVFVKQYRQRKRVEEAEPEISPNRCVDNMLRKALGQEIAGRDVTKFMDAADLDTLGAELKAKLTELGLDTESAQVRADAKVTETDQLSPKCGVMPVSAIVTCGGVNVELKWKATFALAATGDCMVETRVHVAEA